MTNVPASASFVLAVDDLEWTRHWLARPYRCDYLAVSFHPKNEGEKCSVHIRAVESKSDSAVDARNVVPNADPFSEGVGQVIATLESLWELMQPSGSDKLVQDLRFASFIEHLASVALARLYPIQAGDKAATAVLRAISDLSLRNIPLEDIHLDGLVVCMQYRSSEGTAVRDVEVEGESRTWRVLLCRAGTPELDALMGLADSPSVVYLRADAGNGEVPTPETQVVRPEGGSGDHPPGTSDAEPGDGSKTISTAEAAETATSDRVDTGEEVASDLGKTDAEEAHVSSEPSVSKGFDAPTVARDLYLACRRRGIPLVEPTEGTTTFGPALLSISMALEAGASIRPIESSVDDLARELGVASVEVENDPNRPYFVRFLVARSDRVFPTLPDENPALVEAADQSYLGLYLGQTLDGENYSVHVSGWPHMLVGGTTGSGKTTFIRSVLRQLGRTSPTLVQFVIVDGKGEVDYLNLLDDDYFVSHFPEVLLGHQRVTEVLDWVVEEEIERRRSVIHEYAKRSEGRPPSARELYVASLKHAGEVVPFPSLVVVIDEFAELMLADKTLAGQFERRVQQVGQVGRSTLVHLILATQRPDANVVRGAIKANLDARVALRLPTHHDSMTVLGGKGAERLLGKGDLLYQAAGAPRVRLQAYNA